MTAARAGDDSAPPPVLHYVADVLRIRCVSVPESSEVISQNAAVLTAVYQRSHQRGGERYRRDFHRVLSWLSKNPERALRISLTLGDQMCDGMRGQFNLDDPQAGIYLTPTDVAQPKESAVVLQAFLNHLLRDEVADAREAFTDLAVTGTEEVQDFLGLLVALTAFD